MNALLQPFAEFTQAIQAQRPTLSPESIRAAIAAASAVPAEQGAAKPVDEHKMARWLALMGGGALDYGSTLHALSKPGTAEGNPLMKPFAGNPLAFGAVKLGSNAGIGLLLNKMAKKNPKKALVMSLLLGGLQAGVGVNNLRLAAKAGQ